MISFADAYRFTLEQIHPLASERVDLLAAEGRIASQDLLAKVDSPSVDVSLKDGYAVLAADIGSASPTSPVCLNLAGEVAAGGNWQRELHSGEAVSILSGAPLPQGADAVLAEEFTQAQVEGILALNLAEAGRNILRRSADVSSGQLIVPAGKKLQPATIGLLAAAGYAEVPVIKRPRVAILATGDEVLAPGEPLVQGKLYASNLYTLGAWCLHFGFVVKTFVLKDDESAIHAALVTCLEQFDAVLTSGGAWKGEHDLVVKVLDKLGWRKIYHRVRMGPGKAVGFGLFQEKPIFCLPGGPPSNHMAFLQLGLPGLQMLAGEIEPGLPLIPAVLTETIMGQLDWTNFIHGRLLREDQHLCFQPLRMRSRLQELAQTQAIARIPEEMEELSANSALLVQILGG